jgi:hypothetical protein
VLALKSLVILLESLMFAGGLVVITSLTMFLAGRGFVLPLEGVFGVLRFPLIAY